MENEIYLDGNATTCVLPEAVHAAAQAMRKLYGNPSSSHAAGLKAKALLEAVRGRAARLLGTGDGRLMFNSGATEGIQTAVLSALCAVRERRARGETAASLLVYGATEHKAVPESLAHWNRVLALGLTLKKLPVQADGRHDLDALRALLPDAALVCTMAANNETGAISDLQGLGAVMEGAQALWMVDGVQALGKLDLTLSQTRIDYAMFSGHKLYAPKGTGMLYVRAGAPFTPLVVGGGQECGDRSGTENMAGIAALGAVLEALESGGAFRSRHELHGFRERIAASLRRALPGLVFNAPFATTLPTTLNFSVPGLSGRELLDVFDAANMRVSAGSACSAARAAPSPVLQAMGLPGWRSANAVRLSFGPLVDEATIAGACERIARCGDALRRAGMVCGHVPALPQDGVLQLTANGAHTWLLLDAASRGCVVIDPQPEFDTRMDRLLDAEGFRINAVLRTGDGTGWTQDGNRLALGSQVLQRLRFDNGRVCYLLGSTIGGELTARHAFIGDIGPDELPAGIVTSATVLCPARETQGILCTTLDANPEVDTAAPAMNLESDALETFFAAHPDAVLVDVREAYEHAACGSPAPAARVAVSVPLSRLVGRLPDWLRQRERMPLVFFCRSGNRSAKAAQCLRSLGYGPSFHVSGGMALAASAVRTVAAP